MAKPTRQASIWAMSNTAPSRADPVVVFPLSRWCPPQETSQPHPPPRWEMFTGNMHVFTMDITCICLGWLAKKHIFNCKGIWWNVGYRSDSKSSIQSVVIIWASILNVGVLPHVTQLVRHLYIESGLRPLGSALASVIKLRYAHWSNLTLIETPCNAHAWLT